MLLLSPFKDQPITKRGELEKYKKKIEEVTSLTTKGKQPQTSLRRKKARGPKMRQPKEEYVLL